MTLPVVGVIALFEEQQAFFSVQGFVYIRSEPPRWVDDVFESARWVYNVFESPRRVDDVFEPPRRVDDVFESARWVYNVLQAASITRGSRDNIPAWSAT